jgi:hypothetical protein
MHVRFAPKADKSAGIALSPLRARKRHMHRSKQHHYSIASSASASSRSGISAPNALAVLRLMTSSNLVGFESQDLLGVSD